MQNTFYKYRPIKTPASYDPEFDFRPELKEWQKGLGAAGDELQAMGGGLVALGAQHLKSVTPGAVGDNALDSTHDWGMGVYRRNMEEATAGRQAPKVARLEEIKSPDDAMSWASYQLGKGIPMLASLAVPGGVGAAAGKTALKQGTKGVLKSAVGRKVAGETVTEATKKAAKAEAQKYMKRGALAGGAAGAFGIEGGAAYGEMVEEGLPQERAAAAATGVGGINAALEMLPIYHVAKRLGMGDYAKHKVGEIIKGDKKLANLAVELARRVGGAGLEGATTEGMTEGLQELVNVAGTRWAKEDPLFAELTDEERSSIVNAAAAGGLVGGAVGGPAGVFAGPRSQSPEAETAGTAEAPLGLPAPESGRERAQGREPIGGAGTIYGEAPVQEGESIPGERPAEGEFIPRERPLVPAEAREGLTIEGVRATRAQLIETIKLAPPDQVPLLKEELKALDQTLFELEQEVEPDTDAFELTPKEPEPKTEPRTGGKPQERGSQRELPGLERQLELDLEPEPEQAEMDFVFGEIDRTTRGKPYKSRETAEKAARALQKNGKLETFEVVENKTPEGREFAIVDKGPRVEEPERVTEPEGVTPFDEPESAPTTSVVFGRGPDGEVAEVAAEYGPENETRAALERAGQGSFLEERFARGQEGQKFKNLGSARAAARRAGLEHAEVVPDGDGYVIKAWPGEWTERPRKTADLTTIRPKDTVVAAGRKAARQLGKKGFAPEVFEELGVSRKEGGVLGMPSQNGATLEDLAQSLYEAGYDVTGPDGMPSHDAVLQRFREQLKGDRMRAYSSALSEEERAEILGLVPEPEPPLFTDYEYPEMADEISARGQKAWTELQNLKGSEAAMDVVEQLRGKYEVEAGEALPFEAVADIEDVISQEAEPNDIPFFSKPKPQGARVRVMDARQVRTELESVLGSGLVKRLEQSGLLKIYEGEHESRASGFWDPNTGRIQLNARYMPLDGSVAGVLLHEGAHGGLDALLGYKLDSFVRDIAKQAQKGNKLAGAAMERAVAQAKAQTDAAIERGRLDKNDVATVKRFTDLIVREETAAYYIQHAEAHGANRGVVRRMLNEIRASWQNSPVGRTLGFDVDEKLAAGLANQALKETLAIAEELPRLNTMAAESAPLHTTTISATVADAAEERLLSMPEGVGEYRVFQETGLVKGPAGWELALGRGDIFVREGLNKKRVKKLEDVIDSPKLFQAVPALKNQPVQFAPMDTDVVQVVGDTLYLSNRFENATVGQLKPALMRGLRTVMTQDWRGFEEPFRSRRLQSLRDALRERASAGPRYADEELHLTVERMMENPVTAAQADAVLSQRQRMQHLVGLDNPNFIRKYENAAAAVDHTMRASGRLDERLPGLVEVLSERETPRVGARVPLHEGALLAQLNPSREYVLDELLYAMPKHGVTIDAAFDTAEQYIQDWSAWQETHKRVLDNASATAGRTIVAMEEARPYVSAGDMQELEGRQRTLEESERTLSDLFELGDFETSLTAAQEQYLYGMDSSLVLQRRDKLGAGLSGFESMGELKERMQAVGIEEAEYNGGMFKTILVEGVPVTLEAVPQRRGIELGFRSLHETLTRKGGYTTLLNFSNPTAAMRKIGKELLNHVAALQKQLPATADIYFMPANDARGAIYRRGLKKLGIQFEQDQLGTYKISSMPEVLYSMVPAQESLWKSHLQITVSNAKQGKMTPGQWLGWLKKQPGVKQEELDDLGLEDWLDAQEGSVSKEAVEGFIRAGGVQLEEVVRGGPNLARRALRKALQAREAVDRLKNTITRLSNRVAQDDGVYDDEIAERRAQEDREALATAQEQLPVLEAEAVAAERAHTETVDTYVPPKYKDWSTLGQGQDYRELLITIPRSQRKLTDEELAEYNKLKSKELDGQLTAEEQARFTELQDIGNAPREEYISSHWPEPNVLVHVRFDERVDADGNRTLLVDEVQSDWHQEGRKKGYRGDREELTRETADSVLTLRQAPEGWWEAAEGEHVWGLAMQPEEALDKSIEAYNKALEHRVPDAPFKSSWPLLGIKRAIKWAVDNGFDRVAWTPGDVQARRYNLQNSVREVRVGVADGVRTVNMRRPGEYDNFALMFVDKEGNISQDSVPPMFAGSPLESVLGKELTDKIMGMEEAGVIELDDLAVGGEGMKSFYDKKLVNEVNKYLKKYKTKVQPGAVMVEPGVSQDAWVFDVTPQLKEAARGPMPLYSFAGERGMGREMKEGDRDRLKALMQEIVENDAKGKPSGGLIREALQIVKEYQFQPLMGLDTMADALVNARGSLGDLGYAQELHARGRKQADIKKETGWHKAPDGKWRYEIDDSNAFLLTGTPPKEGQRFLGDIFVHDSLFAVYPELQELEVLYHDRSEYEADFTEQLWAITIPKGVSEEVVKGIMHEVQHAIQALEDFGRGGNPEIASRLQNNLIDRQTKARRLLHRAQRKLTGGASFNVLLHKAEGAAIRTGKSWEKTEEGKRLLAAKAKMDKRMLRDDVLRRISAIADLDTPSVFDIYQSIWGEQEARLVERRLRLSAEERKTRFVESDYDARNAEFVVKLANTEHSYQPNPQIMESGHGVQGELFDALYSTTEFTDGLRKRVWTRKDIRDEYFELGTLQRMYLDYVDMFATVEHKDESVKDAYDLAESKRGAKMDYINRTFVEPLKQKVAATGLSVEEVNDWLAARHIYEDNANKNLAERAAYQFLKDLMLHLRDADKAALRSSMKPLLKNKAPDGRMLSDKEVREEMYNLMEIYAERELPSRDMRNHGILRQVNKWRWKHFKEHASGMYRPDTDAQGNVVPPDRGGIENSAQVPDAREIYFRYKDREDVQEIGRLFDQLNTHQLDVLLEGGLITEREKAAMQADKPHYAPLRREAYDFESALESVRAAHGSGKGLKTRRGSEELGMKPTHVLENALARAHSAAARAQRNIANNYLYDRIMENRAEWGDWFDVTTHHPQHWVDSKGFTRRRATANVPDDNIVVVRKGKRILLAPLEHNQRAVKFAAAANKLDAAKLGSVHKVLNFVNSIVRFTAISASVPFMMANMVRDPLTAVYNMQASEAEQFTGEIFGNYSRSFKALQQTFLKKQRLAGDELTEMVEEWERAGGRISFIESLKEMETGWNAFKRGVAVERTPGVKQVMALFDKIEDANIAVENIMRLSTFDVLLKHRVEDFVARKGRQPTRAEKDELAKTPARIAKDLTTNFNRKGFKTSAMGTLYLFFNATVQGNVQVIRNLAKSKKLAGVAGGTIGFALMMDLMGRALNGDEWDDIPDYEKERNIVLPFKVGSEFIKIPAPWVYNVLWRLGGMIGEMGAGVRSAGGVAADTTAMTLTTFNPMGGPTVAQALAPTAVDPFIQVLENKDFAGNKMRPDNFPGAGHKADAELAWSNTPEVYKDTARLLNELTGGNVVESGWLDFAPSTYENFVNFLGGGLYRFAGELGTAVQEGVKGDLERKEIPIVRQFSARPTSQMDSQLYHERVARILQANQALQTYQSGPRRDLKMYQNMRNTRGKELRMLNQAKDVERQLQSLRQRLRLAERRGDESRVEMLKDRMDSVKRRFNQVYDRRVGG